MRNITKKMVDGYFKAKREIISENDNYNKQIFGITKAEYKVIDKCIYHVYGILPPSSPSIYKLRNFMELSIQEIDTEERYKK